MQGVILPKKMEKIATMLRALLQWLLLPVIFYHSFAHANSVSASAQNNCYLVAEKPFSDCSFFEWNAINHNSPFEVPADHDENSITDVEDNVKIEVIKTSNLCYVIFLHTFSESSGAYRYIAPLSLHYDILSPPPR